MVLPSPTLRCYTPPFAQWQTLAHASTFNSKTVPRVTNLCSAAHVAHKVPLDTVSKDAYIQIWTSMSKLLMCGVCVLCTCMCVLCVRSVTHDWVIAHQFRLVCDLLSRMGVCSRGWELKGQERKIKDIWTVCQDNHDLIGWFCCYWCSTLFNYNRYSRIGAFFNFIEWLKVWFIDLYLYVIFICNFLNVNYFSFLDMFWLVFHHFLWKEYFSRTPVSYMYTNSIELVPRFGLLPSPRVLGY